MVRELGLQRSLQDCFGELFQQAVLADDVFRLLVIGQQLINEGLVDSHRFLILLFRWSFTQLLLQLRGLWAGLSLGRLNPVWLGSVSCSRSSNRTGGVTASGSRKRLTVLRV